MDVGDSGVVYPILIHPAPPRGMAKQLCPHHKSAAPPLQHWGGIQSRALYGLRGTLTEHSVLGLSRRGRKGRRAAGDDESSYRPASRRRAPSRGRAPGVGPQSAEGDVRQPPASRRGTLGVASRRRVESHLQTADPQGATVAHLALKGRHYQCMRRGRGGPGLGSAATSAGFKNNRRQVQISL